jgi:hypothetical protein
VHPPQLQGRLAAALASAQSSPAYATYQVGEYTRAYRTSPLALASAALHGRPDGMDPLHPAAQLASSVLAGAPLLRQELAADLLKHGYVLTGFAFADTGGLLPLGCQFTLDAWPQPAAAGVRGYHKLTPFQQGEVQELTRAWLERMNLAGSRMQLASQPLSCEVRDRAGRVDSLLSARLNAALHQPERSELAEASSAVDSAVAEAAQVVLPGIERRVDYELVSRPDEAPRYLVRVTLLGRFEPEARQVEDPVDNSNVREEW